MKTNTIRLKFSSFEVTAWKSNLLGGQMQVMQGSAENSMDLNINYQADLIEKSDKNYVLSFNLCRYLFPGINPKFQKETTM